MNGPKQVRYDPRYGFHWWYPLPFYPPSHVPPIKKQASSVQGLRPTNQKTTELHPIAPINPFPPDPYIQQFRLSEVLQTGTLFQWLHAPDKDQSKEAIPEANDTAENEASAMENSQSERPKPES